MEVKETAVDGTTIAKLFELCAQYRIPNPSYEWSLEVCHPNKKMVHKVICRVTDIVEDGCGDSKRIAKRLASSKALQKLQQDLEEYNIKYCPKEEGTTERRSHLSDGIHPDSASNYADLCNEQRNGEQTVPDLAKRHGGYGLSFGPSSDPMRAIECLKSISGPKWKALMEMNSMQLKTSNHDWLLKSVAEEQKASVEYYHFAPPPDDNSYLSIVSVNLDPKMTFVGGGTSLELAQMSAAHYALQFFRLSISN